MKCIACKKTIHTAPTGLVALDAIACYSKGSSGSRIFDDLDEPTHAQREIRFFLCDLCLKTNEDIISIRQGKGRFQSAVGTFS